MTIAEMLNLHPNDVFYVYVSQWQPDPEADNPEMPGRKATMLMLRPAEANMLCVCGSTKSFNVCCKRRNYWILVCDNPDFKGYCKVEIQIATYHLTNCQEIKTALNNSEHFRNIVDGKENPQWLFHGNSSYRFTEYGEINLGDIELKPDGILFVTAMSKVRMMAIRKILEGDFGLNEPDQLVEEFKDKGRILKPLRLRDMQSKVYETAKTVNEVKLPAWKLPHAHC